MRKFELVKELTLDDRCDLYAKEFPKFPRPQVINGRIEGLWFMGNTYTTSTGFYGAYPHGYLRRVTSMFPDMNRVIHVCSGSLPPGNYMRVDSVQPADIKCNAEELYNHVEHGSFDIAYVDVPYSVEDCEHYGTVMLSRKKVLDSCHTVVRSGGWVIWLDQVFVNFSKKKWHLGLSVGIIKSTQHRVRAVFGFQKK